MESLKNILSREIIVIKGILRGDNVEGNYWARTTKRPVNSHR